MIFGGKICEEGLQILLLGFVPTGGIAIIIIFIFTVLWDLGRPIMGLFAF